ncbi:hypothetical protein [Micrococcus sp.]|uniref:hypothetical protein n=1 Tax=Micrococcus sp. TaxID=1271 RepID=UPI002A916731|nr:hypothetical protein [Micrococcus sp.]MDY6056037.1 hypothetical protein [Micrococcus sp.]
MPSPSVPPRRPHSAAVYRRRRLAVALAALVLLGLVVGIGVLLGRGLSAGGGGAAEPTVSVAPTPVSSPTPAAVRESGSSTPDAVDPATVDECAPTDLRLSASVSEEQVGRGQGLALRLGVTNLSSTPCRVDVGTARQEFVVQGPDGEDPAMSTRICQEDPTHEDRVLQPHDEQTAVYPWNGRRSSEDCGRRGAVAEPGNYRLIVRLGDLSSRPVAFRITGTPGGSATPEAAASSGRPASPSPSAGDSARASSSPSATRGASPTTRGSASASPRPSATATPSPRPAAGASSSPARASQSREATASPGRPASPSPSRTSPSPSHTGR